MPVLNKMCRKDLVPFVFNQPPFLIFFISVITKFLVWLALVTLYSFAKPVFASFLGKEGRGKGGGDERRSRREQKGRKKSTLWDHLPCESVDPSFLRIIKTLKQNGSRSFATGSFQETSGMWKFLSSASRNMKQMRLKFKERKKAHWLGKKR